MGVLILRLLEKEKKEVHASIFLLYLVATPLPNLADSVFSFFSSTTIGSLGSQLVRS